MVTAGSTPSGTRNITLEITGVEGASSLQPNSATRVRLRGNFNIHGVSRPVTINATVRWIPDSNELRAQARFTVRLTDHNISVPAPVRLKVANEITVNVRLRAPRELTLDPPGPGW